ncbi:MAG: DUF4411 family protein, partial [Ignavibacteriae bacterium]|nr:DUF4411 family protein [Ignavibacteriota bacterium]
IIIDKVLEECTYNSKGLVVKALPYLTEKEFLKTAKTPYNTDSLIAPSTPKFLHQLDTVFVNSIVRKHRNLTDVEFENQKNRFLDDADMKLILLCLNLIEDNKDEDVILVTEETESSNDNKLFKKIPAICKELNILTKTLPELLGKYNVVVLQFK